MAHAQRRAADCLTPKLAAANTRTYRDTLAAHARALGARPAARVTDQAALDGIAQRAHVSATSIVQTRAERMTALVQQQGSVAAAKPAFADWDHQQGDVIGRYESGMTAGQAAQDFYDRNRAVLGGVERIVPPQTDSDDQCATDIDAGDQPLGTFDTYPLHARCPHAIERDFDQPDDPDALWVGADNGDD
jgi:hypothetical protein